MPRRPWRAAGAAPRSRRGRAASRRARPGRGRPGCRRRGPRRRCRRWRRRGRPASGRSRPGRRCSPRRRRRARWGAGSRSSWRPRCQSGPLLSGGNLETSCRHGRPRVPEHSAVLSGGNLETSCGAGGGSGSPSADLQRIARFPRSGREPASAGWSRHHRTGARRTAPRPKETSMSRLRTTLVAARRRHRPDRHRCGRRVERPGDPGPRRRRGRVRPRPDGRRRRHRGRHDRRRHHRRRHPPRRRPRLVEQAHRRSSAPA